MYSDKQKERHEAAVAARNALRTLEEMLSYLRSANGWATWDLLGGGLLSSIIKHTKISRSNQLAGKLQNELQILQKELKDVHPAGDLQTSVCQLLAFADFVFDDLLSDWAVKSRVQQSISYLEGLQLQVQTILYRLEHSL